MKRLGVIILCLFSFARASPLEDTWTSKIVALHNSWSVFFKTYFGCPKKAREIQDCYPSEGGWDLRAFNDAKHAAMKLFNLKESK